MTMLTTFLSKSFKPVLITPGGGALRLGRVDQALASRRHVGLQASMGGGFYKCPLTTHLSKMILSGLGASKDRAPVGRRKQGPPSVVFQPYLSSSSSSSSSSLLLTSCDDDYLSLHAACPPPRHCHWLALLVSLSSPPDVQTGAETEHWNIL